MMRKKIERSKTQKKESRSMLPSLKMPSRLVTMESFFAPNQTRKLSQNINKKQPSQKEKFQLRRFVDENIYQMISGKNSTKFSKKKYSNQLITIQQIGPNTLLAKSNPASIIVDYASDQYQGLRDYNQDRILANLNVKILDKIYHIFGVFDGHGGSIASEYVKNNFVKTFQEQINENPLVNLIENLRKTIYKIQAKLNDLYKCKQFVGGTCATIIIFHENSYYIAHLGDSRVLHVKSKDQKLQYQQLTTDHKPDEKNEKIRIQKMGGKVYRNKLNMNSQSNEFYGPYRIIPGKLSVSRTIADFQVKNLPNGNVITCEPQLQEGKIEQTSLFLLFSDGAYERFENSQIVEYFSKKKRIQDIQIRKSIQSFLINSILKQSNDNISMISIIAKEKKILP